MLEDGRNARHNLSSSLQDVLEHLASYIFTYLEIQMAKFEVQKTTDSLDDWCKFDKNVLDTPPECDFLLGNSSLEKSIEVVKDKFWSFSDALKDMAQALVRYGVSPSLLGYSSVSSFEDKYIQEQEDGEAALQKVSKEDFFCRMLSSSKSTPLASNEEVGLMHVDEEEDDQLFLEASRTDEHKPLTRQISWVTVEEDGQLHNEDD